jgi:galactokinase
MPKLRESLGDRAIMRAMHFLSENERVEDAKAALLGGDIDGFFNNIRLSGNSSFKFLQNVYTTQNVREQGLSLALCLTEEFLRTHGGACRVHGGGFAGTIQSFIKNEDVDAYVELLDSVFGKGAVMPLFVRPLGAVKLF